MSRSEVGLPIRLQPEVVSRPRASSIIVWSLVLLHAPLGLLLISIPTIARLHALGAFLLGIAWVAFGRNRLAAMYVSGYIVGAEVLWRLVGAGVFWEFGKYSATFLLGFGLLRFFGRWRGIVSPILFGVLLLPSLWLTIERLGVSDETRDAISFNMSGPLLIVVAALFFSQLRPGPDELRRLCLAIIAPIVATATVAAFTTVSAPSTDFSQNSNYIGSGGFGPNQVSSVLGLGVVLCVLLFSFERGLGRVLSVALGTLLTAQGLLTFSRGGMFSAGIAILFALIHAITRPRRGFGLAASTIVLVILGWFVVVPALDTFTGGELIKRFTDVDPTGRTEIASADLGIWRENKLVGIGPGLSRFDRQSIMVEGQPAHTEFTRLLAEHGTLGAIALMLLLVIAGRAYLRAPDAMAKAWVAALAMWSLTEMSHAAMRVAAISFVFGMALVGWTLSKRVRKEERSGLY